MTSDVICSKSAAVRHDLARARASARWTLRECAEIRERSVAGRGKDLIGKFIGDT